MHILRILCTSNVQTMSCRPCVRCTQAPNPFGLCHYLTVTHLFGDVTLCVVVKIETLMLATATDVSLGKARLKVCVAMTCNLKRLHSHIQCAFVANPCSIIATKRHVEQRECAMLKFG